MLDDCFSRFDRLEKITYSSKITWELWIAFDNWPILGFFAIFHLKKLTRNWIDRHLVSFHINIWFLILIKHLLRHTSRSISYNSQQKRIKSRGFLGGTAGLLSTPYAYHSCIPTKPTWLKTLPLYETYYVQIYMEI